MRRSRTLIVLAAALAACTGDRPPTTPPPPAPLPSVEARPPAGSPESAPAPAATAPASLPAATASDSRRHDRGRREPLPTAGREAVNPSRPPAEPATDDPLESLSALDLEAIRAGSNERIFDPELPALEPEETALLDELVEEAIPEDYSIPEVRLQRLERTESELPLTLNDEVVRLINYFTGRRGVKTFRATMGRSGAYRDMIERILEEEGVPAELFHLAQAESGFRPKARSYARATGMWQFMAFRGKQYGLRQDRYLEERYDAEKATRAAARHLKDLHIEFGDWNLAMAAYNAGPGRVKRAIERGGTRDYWELCDRNLLPRQTRNYVPIIQAFTYIAKNIDMYDVGTIDYAPPREYDTVAVASEINFELIADITDTTVSGIEDLNPALLRSATPPYDYELRLPKGAADRFRREIAAIPADKRLDWRRHEVREGETLAAVAKKYGVAEEQLVALNSLEPGAPLEPGMRLTAPATTAVKSYRTYGGAAGGLMEDGTGRYRIASGDTLGGIARRFSVSVAQLRSWNGLPSTRIRAGRYLIVRPEGATSSASSSAAPNGTYRVRAGDTLGKIAARFGASVRQLQSWNGLTSTRIMVGQRLKVPGLPSSDETTASTGGAPSASPAPAGAGQYRIRSGDTLAGIAQRFGVGVDDLRAWNGVRGSRITAGDYLRVRPPSAAAAAGSAAATNRTYRVRSGDNLTLIARRNGVSVDDLRAWNSLRSTRLDVGQELVIRGGSSSPEPAPSDPEPRRAVASAAPSGPPPAPPPARSSSTRYIVRSGDTLGHIAERFGVLAQDIRDWNGMRGSRIMPGDSLIVRPGADDAPRAAAAPAPAPSSSDSPAPSSGPTIFNVRSGDTHGAISERYGVSVGDLRAWNGIAGNRIDIGQKLHLRQPSTDGGRYRVQRGDTLALIARRFGVTVRQLQAWNNLRSTRITAGEYLTVKPVGNSRAGS